MSDLKRWRVTGPDGFEFFTPWFANEAEAMEDAFVASILTAPYVMRQAGYRAEPIEEPKMVTVRADALRELLRAHDRSITSPCPCLASKGSLVEIRAALDGDK